MEKKASTHRVLSENISMTSPRFLYYLFITLSLIWNIKTIFSNFYFDFLVSLNYYLFDIADPGVPSNMYGLRAKTVAARARFFWIRNDLNRNWYTSNVVPTLVKVNGKIEEYSLVIYLPVTFINYQIIRNI